eukprot:5026808-Prymnesium_polylepis.1
MWLNEITRANRSAADSTTVTRHSAAPMEASPLGASNGLARASIAASVASGRSASSCTNERWSSTEMALVAGTASCDLPCRRPASHGFAVSTAFTLAVMRSRGITPSKKVTVDIGAWS